MCYKHGLVNGTDNLGLFLSRKLRTDLSFLQEGSLIISPVAADDAGYFVCELTNGIGRPQRAKAYLGVECEYILWQMFQLFHF